MKGMRTALVAMLATGCEITVDGKGFGDSGDSGTTPPTTTTPTDETGGPTDTGEADPDRDGDGFPASEDCDDGNPDLSPGEPEWCDGIDNNCDGGVDDEAAATIRPPASLSGGTTSTGTSTSTGTGTTSTGTSSGGTTTGTGTGTSTTGTGTGSTTTGTGTGSTTGTSTGGTTTGTTGTPPGPPTEDTNYLTLDEALDVVEPDSKIDVCAGDHVIVGRSWGVGSLKIVGVSGRDVTTISEVDGNTLLDLDDATMNLKGVSLVGSTARAVRVRGTTTLELVDARLADNPGGALELRSTTDTVVTLDGTEIRGNGLPADVGVPAMPAAGGGILANGDYEIVLTDSQILGNYAGTGAGVHLTNLFGSGLLQLDGSVLNENVAEFAGGGGYLAHVTLLGLGGASISTNAAASGGGLTVVRAAVQDVSIRQNQAALHGGGIEVAFDPAFEPAFDLSNALVGVVVDSNTADVGAGLSAADLASLDATSNVTLNVAATRGGGLDVMPGDFDVISLDADWGVASLLNDNAPDDVAAAGATHVYDGPVTFTCNGDSGCD